MDGIIALGLIGYVIFSVVWHVFCMLACAASGLALRLCVGPLRRDEVFERQFPRFAGRAAGLGVAGIAVGAASTAIFLVLFFILFFTSDGWFTLGIAGVWVCTVLCIVCGVLLLALAKKLSWAIGAGAPYRRRRTACILCGVLALLASISGIVLGVLSIASDLFVTLGIV